MYFFSSFFVGVGPRSEIRDPGSGKEIFVCSLINILDPQHWLPLNKPSVSNRADSNRNHIRTSRYMYV
jgi:hypothetical protein